MNCDKWYANTKPARLTKPSINFGTKASGTTRRTRPYSKIIFALHTNMSNKKIVLDTNGLISSLSRRGQFYPIWRSFQQGRYTLCISNEINEGRKQKAEGLTRPKAVQRSNVPKGLQTTGRRWSEAEPLHRRTNNLTTTPTG